MMQNRTKDKEKWTQNKYFIYIDVGSVNLDSIYLYTFAVPDCLTKERR